MNFRDAWPILVSLQAAGCALALIVIVGTPIAWILARGRFPGKTLIAAFLSLPLVLPPTVLGYVLLLIFSRRAWLGHWLEQTLGLVVVFRWPGLVIAASIAAFPMFLLPARAAFEAVDQRLENAARLLGHGEWSVFRRVTLPLAWRGLVAGGLLAFIRALGDFGATLMLVGNTPGPTQTASLAIYNAAQEGDSTKALALSIAISLIALVTMMVVQKNRKI